MGTDVMIQALSQLFMYMLPVAGFVLLVYLILLLRDFRVTVQQITPFVEEIKKTMEQITPCLEEFAKLSDNCNTQLTKFDKTISNVADFSNSTTSLVSADMFKNVSNILSLLNLGKNKK